MPQLFVSKLKPGVILADKVITSLGGTLFEKGTQLNEREIEILQAFLISKVNVELDASSPVVSDANQETEVEETAKSSFNPHLDKAIDFVEKIMQWAEGGMPLPVMELRNHIQPLLANMSIEFDMIDKLSKLRSEDSYIFQHSIAVSLLSVIIARWNKVPEKEHMQIALAGILHNIGLCRINPHILTKKGPLTLEERREMEQHPIYGYSIIKKATGLNEGVALAALQHHEREDGSGYPNRLKGDKIHLYAKIVAIADIFHAMISKKSYRDAVSPYLVFEQLMEYSFGKLDPVIVRSFVQGMTHLSSGITVKLNDGRIGKIIFIDSNNPTRPMVDIGGQIVNLTQSRHLFIEGVIF
ncbi:HD-GYP domain-containing protein [Aneurinibacillus terranovensis]|uniref:HD-GYP domain-containing protein n=1 Tax=Aneurinibacillus terranovensis TaxID=278991 RepID=UPI0003FD9645|nr:HD-GYP domain-containing protein [Aneurinibacillus terranovensis]